jgi:hypothetical protein
MLIGCLVLLLLATLLNADERDDQARKAVADFLRALKAKDLEGILKLVDVPWFHDGQRVVRSRDELKTIFQKLLDKQSFADVVQTIKRIQPYANVSAQLEPSERALLDEVLEKDDRIVLLNVTKEGKQQESVVLLVRTREGKTAIVGIRE